MNTKEFVKYHQLACNKLHEIVKAKNADYTGESQDPFLNLNMVEKFEVSTTETGIFTRMLDKFTRISSFIKKGVLKVKDETVEDTLFDLANYCILMAAYIVSKKGGKII
jgi:hypothetical protein